jgi:sigma-B regulation protein RsbU (phosphoserine phosphatase)
MSDPIRPDPAISPFLDHALATLAAAGQEAFQAQTNLNELLRVATRHCRRLVEADQVRVWVLRRGGRRLVAYEFPEDGGSAKVLRHGPHEGLAGWAVGHRESLRLGPGDARPALRGHVPRFTAALVLPLFRRGEVFGAIECLDKRGGGGFGAEDFDRLDVAAEQIAFALDSALLYEETERRALEKEVLLEVSKTLATPLDLDGVMDAIFTSLREVVSYDAAAIYLVHRRTQLLGLVSQVGYPEGSEDAFGLQVGQGIVGWVAKTGEPVIVPDVKRDPRYVTARPGTRSELATPLRVGGRILGVFNLESDLDDAYHEGHLELLSAFAAQAALAIERAQLMGDRVEQRRLEKELAIAREIQASFLPTAAPAVPGFDLAGATMPADEVGGDYFDFIPVSEGRMGLAIADVSGKGIPAALIMAGFRMSLLAEIRNEFAIRAVMRKVNSLLYESIERDKFVTAFYGVLDARNRVLTFSNAGHNPPLLRHRDGGIEELTDGGVALGVLPDGRYEDRPVPLRPGDVLLLYTDGVSEAEAPSGEQFGRARIEQAVARLAHRGAREILDGLVDAVRVFAGERGQNDDLTLLVVKALDA